MFTLTHPYLLSLLILPAFMRYFSNHTIQKNAILPVPFFDQYTTYEKTLNKFNHQTWRTGCYYLIWVLMVLALTRPVHFGPPINHTQSGRNIMLAVDISDSMRSADMTDHHQRIRRIDLVKKVAKNFILNCQGDRIGLILFGSQAFLQAPLSFDLETVSALLEDTPVGIAGSYTAIGDAIGLAIKRLKQVSEKQRILILLTDGAANTGTLTPLQAAKLAKDYQIKIYTIGLGSAQIAMSNLLGNTFFATNTNDLDEKTLKEIAQLTGGSFFRANNNEDLNNIYHNINQLEPIQKESEQIRVKTDYYYYPVLIALLLSIVLYYIFLL